MSNLLSLLRSIGFIEEIEKLLPELPELPNQRRRIVDKKERVRHAYK